MTPEHETFDALRSAPISDLLAAIEAYGFADLQGHPLHNCAEYVELGLRLVPVVGVAHV